jgi:hypothetical protein
MLVEKKVVEFVEVQKTVIMNTEREIMREVQVETRIPVELIREKEVPMIH